MIREDGRLIIGKGDLSLLYSPLIVNHPEISEVLYPCNQVDEISSMLLWIKKSLRKQTSVLIQKTISASQDVRDSCHSSGGLKADVVSYLTSDLKECEKKLSSGNLYLSGSKISIIDLIVYCEISTIVKMHNCKIPSDLMPSTALWYTNIGQLNAIQKMDNFLEVAVKKNKLGF